MSGMRITQSSVAANAAANIQAAYARAGKLSAQVSSGKKLNVPSDDPSGAVAAMGLRADVAAKAQYSRNASDGLGWLNTADTALQSASSTLNSALSTLVNAANQGALSADGRAALAAQVRAYRDELLNTANVTYQGRPVFGGTTAGDAAFATTADASGAYAYQGDSGAVMRRLDDHMTTRVDTSGKAAFVNPATGKSVFQALDEIAARVESGQSLAGDLDTIKGYQGQIRTALADVGARSNQVTALQNAADDATVTLKSGIAGIEDADIAQSVMDFQMANLGYQAALGASARVMQKSLLDFLG